MSWKNEVEQLAALLEKIPHPQTFEMNKGVYQPYFLIELRPANWEIIPFADYTRLDGQPGKKIKLSFQLVESQKVNITQDELNVLSYLYSFTNYDTRRLFSYGQPIGFLLEWLQGSRLKINSCDKKKMKDLPIHEEIGLLSLGLFKQEDSYLLRPALVFPDHTIILKDHIDVLSANPIYLCCENTLYRVESNMSAFFWINFFRFEKYIKIFEKCLGLSLYSQFRNPNFEIINSIHPESVLYGSSETVVLPVESEAARFDKQQIPLPD